MSKLKASDMEIWTEGYVNWSSVYEDLFKHVSKNYTIPVTKILVDQVIEYLGESEHDGMEPKCHEVSSDAMTSVPKWVKKREELLIEDFDLYFSEAE